MQWIAANFVTIIDGFAYGLLLFTLAVGLSLVFGMMDVLNLAHGTLYLIGAYAAHALSDGSWWSLGLAALVGTVAAGLGGALLSGLTLPLGNRGHLDQALLTLGISFIGAELLFEVFGSRIVNVPRPSGMTGSIAILGNPYPVYRLLFIAIAGALAVAVYVTLERSTLGALVRATVADRDMVRTMGVDTRKVLLGVFVAGAALAGIGGALGGPLLQPGPGVDERVLVLSLVVIVIGGLGSVRGALLGAILIGQVQSLGVALLPGMASFLLFGAMLLVLVLRPQGLIPAGAGRSDR